MMLKSRFSSSFLVVVAWTYLASLSHAAPAQEQRWAPEIPRVWDDERIAAIELPLPSPTHSPQHVSSEFYYAIPARVIYKSYDIYHPDYEPEGYWEWLHEQEPEVVFDPAKLKTKEDWIRAGEFVFTEGNEYSTATELAFVRDRKAYEATGIRLAEGGRWPYGRYFIREKGKVELGTDSCATCHTRVLPDGSLLRGGPGDMPLGQVVAYELRQEAGKNPHDAGVVDETWGEYASHAAPWLDPDPGAIVLGMSLEELAHLWQALPPGVQARQRSAFQSPARVPDLIGIQNRRYLDASGLMQHDSLGDLMRYAALNQGADSLSSFGGFVPEARGKGAPLRPGEFTRYSDEQLYSLGLFLYSLEPPPNPNAFDDAAARGREVFQRERCFTCHPSPLYTNNELSPVLDFDPSQDHEQRFSIMGRSIDTDPGLTLRTRRGTGYYKVPSLLGLWYRGPFFHDGSLATLEDVFDPARLENDYVPSGFRGAGVEAKPIFGHEYGLDREASERADLVAFLRTL
jgi:hypothetical protein